MLKDLMPIDRELVQKFLLEVGTQIIPAISAGAAKLDGRQKLIAKYQAACSAWVSRNVDHVQDITTWVNELCIARLILGDSKVRSASYEPPLEDTKKTIDFLVCLVGTQANIFYDVKTIQPELRDAWGRYKEFEERGRFTPHTELELEEEGMGGEIAHGLFASRQKFLDYTLELEGKIRAIPKNAQSYFRLVFCGDGVQWRQDHLEDFADFYFSGQYRPDDALGSMQAHNMVDKKITFDRSIHGFCYFERKRLALEPKVFRRDVRGPMLPWDKPQSG